MPIAKETESRRLAPAVVRAFDVLRLFLEVGSPLSAGQIGERLGIPRSTAYELIGTLVALHGLARLPGEPDRFELGLAVFELGMAYANRLDLAREGQAVAEQVVAECDETVQVATLDGKDCVYVAKVDCTHPLRLVSAVGRRIPAHLTAGGKVLLGALSEDNLDALYQHRQVLPGWTTASIRSLPELKRVLDEARRTGIGVDYCESNTDVQCVAAPVRNHAGQVVAALSISVPVTRSGTTWPDRRFAKLAQRGASELSRRLGYAATPADLPARKMAR